MKQKRKVFVQHLYHEIEDEEKAEKYLDSSLSLIGLVVMYFNGLEKSLDSIYVKYLQTDQILRA